MSLRAVLLLALDDPASAGQPVVILLPALLTFAFVAYAGRPLLRAALALVDEPSAPRLAPGSALWPVVARRHGCERQRAGRVLAGRAPPAFG